MKITDPEFWEELTKAQHQNLPDTSRTLPKDNAPDTNLEDEVGDDSELPMPLLISAMTSGNLPEGVAIGEDSGLVSVAEAENVDIEEPDIVESHQWKQITTISQKKTYLKRKGHEERGSKPPANDTTHCCSGGITMVRIGRMTVCFTLAYKSSIVNLHMIIDCLLTGTKFLWSIQLQSLLECTK
jgi:hypothetical protein